MNLILIAIGCGLIAVLYGLFTSRQVLNAPAGNQRMIEVAGAIQEGASAYLRRQYTTIGMVGVAVAILVGIFLYRFPNTVGILLVGTNWPSDQDELVGFDVAEGDLAQPLLPEVLGQGFQPGFRRAQVSPSRDLLFADVLSRDQFILLIFLREFGESHSIRGD